VAGVGLRTPATDPGPKRAPAIPIDHAFGLVEIERGRSLPHKRRAQASESWAILPVELSFMFIPTPV